MSQTYDVAVLGVGGVGSAALFHLAGRGLRVLGIDRFAPGHGRGSSHGQTRLIRQAYFEHPDYVPLVKRAYQLWHELEQICGRPLYRQVGILQAGPPNGAVVPGVLASAALHGLPIEQLTRDELRRRFPGFALPDEMAAVFEERAGFLYSEDCVRAHVDQAVQRGAGLLVGAAVHSWQCDAGGVTVETSAGRFQAARAIICAGAWAHDLLTGLGIPLRVVRKPLYWFHAPDDTYAASRGSPGFLFETPDGEFYGFPSLPDVGLKCAEHTGGLTVDDPLHVDRKPIPAETQRVQQFLAGYLPQASPQLRDSAVCMYTLSPDRTFIVDVHPDYPQVAFAAGLSGHGFKFTSVLGEILADLVTAGRSPLPIEFLSCRRFAV